MLRVCIWQVSVGGSHGDTCNINFPVAEPSRTLAGIALKCTILHVFLHFSSHAELWLHSRTPIHNCGNHKQLRRTHFPSRGQLYSSRAMHLSKSSLPQLLDDLDDPFFSILCLLRMEYRSEPWSMDEATLSHLCVPPHALPWSALLDPSPTNHNLALDDVEI